VSGCATGGLSRRARLHGVSIDDVSGRNLEECIVVCGPGCHYNSMNVGSADALKCAYSNS
jgi:hypothetical protein